MQEIPFIGLFKSALHVSGDKLAHRQEHFFDCIYNYWYNAPILLMIGGNLALPPLHLVGCLPRCSDDARSHKHQQQIKLIYGANWHNYGSQSVVKTTRGMRVLN